QHGVHAFRRPIEALADQFGDRADGIACHTAYESDAVILVEKVCHGGRIGRNIKDHALPDDDRAGAAIRPRQPYSAHKRGLVDIDRHVTDRIHLSDSWFSAHCTLPISISQSDRVAEPLRTDKTQGARQSERMGGETGSSLVSAFHKNNILFLFPIYW